MKKIIALILLLITFSLSLFSCVLRENAPLETDPLPQETSESQETQESQETSSPPQLIITPEEDMTAILHAGGELDGIRLLNCQEAFYVYYEKGCRYFEYDFKLSSDGKLISTHSWEHLGDGCYDDISYDDFTALTLEGGYTPANEEWLVEILREYPDVTIIIDAKMETTLLDAEVIKRVAALEGIYNIDLSDRIIPEVFSTEMWDAIKNETSFNKYLFSHYKVYYSIDKIVENFPTDQFVGIAIPYSYLDDYYKRNIAYLQSIGYDIYMFGINSAEDVNGARKIGADTVYVDNINMMPLPME